MLRILFFWFALSTACSACSCAGPPKCGAIGGADRRYFIGIPVGHRVLPYDQKNKFARAVYSFRVSESFTSELKPGQLVEVRTGLGGGDCGWHFKTGETYLVDPYKGEDSSLSTSICSHTALVADIQPLIQQLRAVAENRPAPSLAGSLLSNRDWQNGQTTYLKDTPVTLRAATGKTYSSRTDSTGTFIFWHLPPGKYVLEPDLPTSLKLWKGYAEDSAGITIPAAKDRNEAVCRAYLMVEPTAGIHGKVLLPAKTVAHLNIVALHLSEGTQREEREETPTPDGTFDLRSLPSGTYKLEVRKDGYRGKLMFSKQVEVYDGQTTEVILAP